MPLMILVLMALTSGLAQAHPANACPAALSKIFRFGQLMPPNERAATLHEIRSHVFPGFVLKGQPSIEPIHETSDRDWPQRDHRVAGRLALHEMEDSATELVEADPENPQTSIQNYGYLVGLRSAVNLPEDYDPLGLLRGIRNLSLMAGAALPLTYFCMESEPYPMVRFSIAAVSGAAMAFARICHSVIRKNAVAYPDISLGHANLHAHPERGAWVYSGVNLAYYIDEWHVAAMPVDAVTFVDSKGKARTFFLIQPTPFRNSIEDNDPGH